MTARGAHHRRYTAVQLDGGGPWSLGVEWHVCGQRGHLRVDAVDILGIEPHEAAFVGDGGGRLRVLGHMGQLTDHGVESGCGVIVVDRRVKQDGAPSR